MKKITIIVESGYAFNNRFTKITNGIISSCKENGYSFSVLELENIKPAKSNSQPIIVIGASIAWTTSAVQILSQNNYHPIVVGFNFPNFSCTFITQNHYLDAYVQTSTCLRKSEKSIAFIGLNPLSFCDRSKYAGFQDAIKHFSISISSENVYPITTATQCVDSFLSKAMNYDTIFCVNDTIALILISKLSKPEKYNIISFGDLYIKRYCSCPFHSLSPNYYNMGRISVDIFSVLQNYPYVSNSTIYVESHLDASNNRLMPDILQQSVITDSLLFSDEERILSDENSNTIDLLSNTLEHCDETDIRIIQCVCENMTFEQTAESMYMSTNSVKRRFKKILTNSAIKNKKQFLETVSRFKLDFA